MNNPPDISQDPSEHEEYAHNVQKHVRGYLMVGATLLAFTAITVALSYVNFGAPKEHCRCHVGSDVQGRISRLFSCTLPKNSSSTAFSFLPVSLCSDFSGIFRVMTTPSFVKCRKGFQLFSYLLDAACARIGYGVSGSFVAARHLSAGAICSLWCGRARRLRRLVLSENETAASSHDRENLVDTTCRSFRRGSAGAICYGAKMENQPNMAVRFGFFGAVMSVLGGIGAFSFHLWRHGLWWGLTRR
jgi:hypothetical protein